VEALFNRAEAQQAQVWPESGPGEAITSMLNQADPPKRHLDEGRLTIDNSACERSLRGLAIGRKNWLFTGRQAGGEAAAAMFSLIASAKRNNLNVYRHLSDVGRHPPATPTSQLHPFLPDRWQAPTPERSNLHASDASSPRPPAPRPCLAASAHTTGAVERLRHFKH
jgi:hypothetical protein